MTAPKQHLLSLRFEIDDCVIFALSNDLKESLFKHMDRGGLKAAQDKTEDAHCMQIIYRDTIISSAWGSIDGQEEFSINPKNYRSLKTTSKKPTLDKESTYIIWRGLDIGWGHALLDPPFSRKQLTSQWVYKERPGYGSRHLVSIRYRRMAIDLKGQHETLHEDVVVIHKGKVLREFCGLPKVA